MHEYISLAGSHSIIVEKFQGSNQSLKVDALFRLLTGALHVAKECFIAGLPHQYRVGNPQ